MKLASILIITAATQAVIGQRITSRARILKKSSLSRRRQQQLTASMSMSTSMSYSNLVMMGGGSKSSKESGCNENTSTSSDWPIASQKRQGQRDDRRGFVNPNRSQTEEDKERAQKTGQSNRRGCDQVDPYGGFGQRDYDARREAIRVRTCERFGENCRYSTVNSECYNGCVDEIGSRGAARNASDGGQRVDQECARQCIIGGDLQSQESVSDGEVVSLRKQRHRYRQQLNELSTSMSYSNLDMLRGSKSSKGDTPTPTFFPTVSPSLSPSLSPTLSPSFTPTYSPTTL